MTFKKSSDNSQSRTDRHAIHSRQNDAGVDPAAFSHHPEANADTDRAKMVRDKVQIEAKLAQVNAQIRSAKDSFNRNKSSQSGHDIVAKWEAQRATLARRLNGLNSLLMQCKLDRVMKASDERQASDDFSQFFMMLAKEMLAESIYNRIVVAAHHRQHEKKQESKRPTGDP